MSDNVAMGIVKRAFIITASVGWIAPLSASFWASYDFLWNVVWPRASWGQIHVGSWHPIDRADDAFYLSMLWLAAAIFFWTIHLTRAR
jgi:hypothetical protein